MAKLTDAQLRVIMNEETKEKYRRCQSCQCCVSFMLHRGVWKVECLVAATPITFDLNDIMINCAVWKQKENEETRILNKGW